MTSVTSSSSGNAFNQPNASNQSATLHSSQDSSVITSAEADASDQSRRAESEPETQATDQSVDDTEHAETPVDHVLGEKTQEVPIRKTADPTESVVACTVEVTGINSENESTCSQSKTMLNTLRLDVELTEVERNCSADGECENELHMISVCSIPL
jgi:5'-deoxynucleotidase YfbR-like HD superfamily hydrolase